uniref:Uncharacterized protein n=1 Tax=Rangifer tarandus platyrhynchus TaxID=3082113 RepID=A0ACB0F5A9_RANTA|nr:unnamed protein product [Rangifer tarandus platyrhynchus]
MEFPAAWSTDVDETPLMEFLAAWSTDVDDLCREIRSTAAVGGGTAHRSGAPRSRPRRLCLPSSFPELWELKILAAVRWSGMSRRHAVHHALEGQASPGASQELQLPEASRALGPARQGEH